MELTLDADHPLAVAIMESPFSGDTWLVLKTPQATPYSSYRTTFRASVTKWSRDTDSLAVEFETWDEFMERKAQLAGL